MTKRCTNGHEVVGSNAYREGDRIRCRECRNAYFKKWRERNPEYDLARYAADPTKKRLGSARYRVRNPEKAKAGVLRWKAANPEKNAEAQRRWRVENPEKAIEGDRRKRRNNPEKYLVYSRNKRARKRAAAGSFTESEWLKVCARFGHRCPSCGKHCALTADHIIPLSKGGTNDISNIQPLCRSCNARKNNRLIVCYLRWLGEVDSSEVLHLQDNRHSAPYGGWPTVVIQPRLWDNCER